jgi:hypothetical protein
MVVRLIAYFRVSAIVSFPAIRAPFQIRAMNL